MRPRPADRAEISGVRFPRGFGLRGAAPLALRLRCVGRLAGTLTAKDDERVAPLTDEVDVTRVRTDGAVRRPGEARHSRRSVDSCAEESRRSLCRESEHREVVAHKCPNIEAGIIARQARTTRIVEPGDAVALVDHLVTVREA